LTADDAPILDLAVIAELREMTGDDDDFIRELVEAYLAEAPEHLAGMTAAAGAGDAAAMVRPAHTLKSSSASLGAMRLSRICRGLEEAARAGRAEGFHEAVGAASATWAATLAALAEAGLTG
jgi:HPt (histidine-containing phosphotransfer) domain-containing protein